MTKKAVEKSIQKLRNRRDNIKSKIFNSDTAKIQHHPILL